MAYAINIEDFKKAKVSQILILFNVITFVFLNVILNDPLNPLELVKKLAQEKDVVINGEYWRLVSSIFIHWDIGHLFNNMIGLLLFGTILELQFSKKFYILTYFICGLMGSLFTFLLTGSGIYSAGASGAIFGLMGVSFMIFSKRGKNIYYFGLFYIIYSLVYSLQPNIGFWSHLFGLITGLVVGYVYYGKINKTNDKHLYK